MKRNKGNLSGITTSPSLDVFLKIMLDLGFKFLCYIVVYKFYVHIKPRFCRKPVIRTFKNDEDKENCDEESKNKNADIKDKRDVIDENVPSKTANRVKTPLNQPDEHESLNDDEDEDKFVEEAEKLISALNARKTYSSSNTIKALYEELKKREDKGK